MSTSDQPDHGPLTRKQLREIRLTGSTPVITAEDAESAAKAAAAPAPVRTEPVVPPAPVAAPVLNPDGSAPLTRRQVREQERIRTASVPVIEPVVELPVVEEAPVEEAPVEEAPVEEAPVDEAPAEEIVSAVPVFAKPAVEEPAVAEPEIVEPEIAEPEIAEPAPGEPAAVEPGDEDDDVEEQVEIAPVSAAAAAETAGDAVLEVLDDADADDVAPTVNPAFGDGVLTGDAPRSFAPSFDELIGDSGGSQSSPNALIFNPPAGEPSLSGPVASTGEILVTGSYELPQGLGSQGHAHGVADGKDVDAVLIDGELPPASSPTPIAASAAVSTIKPAGEVIRPPAPEKGNKLMLTLAIVAGGLALALGVVLVIAITSNVFNT